MTDADIRSRGRVERLTKADLLRVGPERLTDFLLAEAARDARLNGLLRKAVAAIAEDAPDTPAPKDPDEPHMVGTGSAMLAVFERIRKVANTRAPILITGESGTGKELAARAIHERSPYVDGPFVAINCAGLPPTLISSELFGYERGAFTGAYQRKPGRIEAAQGGTLFLDEIGDLPLELQAHLLRFLQEKTIDRLGGHQAIRVDVRIVAATNQDLTTAIAEGRFRKDLFYRLNVIGLELPPLRERGNDIELLATYFLRKFAHEMNRDIQEFDLRALRAIKSHSWPGNVRELISCVRRAVVMCEGDSITLEDLGAPWVRDDAASYDNNVDRLPPVAVNNHADGLQLPHKFLQSDGNLPPLSQLQNELEDWYVRKILERTNYNLSRAAKELQVSRVTLYRILERHAIDAGRRQETRCVKDASLLDAKFVPAEPPVPTRVDLDKSVRFAHSVEGD